MAEYALDNVGIRKLVISDEPDEPGPQRLYSSTEIGEVVGMSRYWIIEHAARDDAPDADFIIVRGKQVQPLWTAASVDRWRAYCADIASTPPVGRYTGNYSDHNAINQLGPITVTWKLSWRNTHDGGTEWWFSTPKGWYVSNDDGKTWDWTDAMTRPPGYRYLSVNATSAAGGTIVAVLRSAEKLRRSIE